VDDAEDQDRTAGIRSNRDRARQLRNENRRHSAARPGREPMVESARGDMRHAQNLSAGIGRAMPPGSRSKLSTLPTTAVWRSARFAGDGRRAAARFEARHSAGSRAPVSRPGCDGCLLPDWRSRPSTRATRLRRHRLRAAIVSELRKSMRASWRGLGRLVRTAGDALAGVMHCWPRWRSWRKSGSGVRSCTTVPDRK